MSYICYATKEPVHPGTKMILFPLKQRQVKYVNYVLHMRGNKLIKQYVGTTEGVETVQEVPISPEKYDEFIKTHPVEIVDAVKPQIVERDLYPIKQQIKDNAEKSGNVETINTLPTDDKNKDFGYNRFSDLIEDYDGN